MKKKRAGVVVFDQRGKQPSANKTSDEKMQFIRNHIESFPRVESHYTRKDTKREYLGADLNIKKMYDQYVLKCKEAKCAPVAEATYRKIFKNEYGFSFHHPKKDQCQACNAYRVKEKLKIVTEEERKAQEEHVARKETACNEKNRYKEMAKKDPSVYCATFDLEAVLYTPCSNVSQLFL
jgi:hypothetical protein